MDKNGNNKNVGQELSYYALCKMLKNLAKECGITKKVTPSTIRNARIAELSGKMTKGEMNDYFGWKNGSKMTCAKVTDEELEDAILAMHGIVKNKDK